MGKLIKIAGLTFELLEPYEIEDEIRDCNHKWHKAEKQVIVNPAGQFVKGYGNNLVSVVISAGRQCSKCGLFEQEKEVDKHIKSEKLDKILKLKPKKNRTICQMLRELRKDNNKKKVDACLLIAKKMNDKLVEYAGKNFTKDWYDENGDFIL